MRRTTLLLLIVGVLATLWPAHASAQSSAWPSGNGLLAFRSDRDGEPDVFVMDASGANPTKLTLTHRVGDLQPAFSPDGGRIALVRRPNLTGRPDLYVMTAEGKGRTRLTTTIEPERDPSWNPSGTRLVFATRLTRTSPFRIFVMNADGSGRVQLTSQAAGRADRAPVFSPDGSRIAFASDRDGGFPELYVMNANGSGVKRLTSNSAIDGNPSWTPDGTRLVFERCCSNGTSDLVAIDVATRQESVLTDTSDRQEFDPVVSPDGAMVAFVAFEVGVGNIDVWTMGLDGSGAARLTQDPAPDTSPDWQPIPSCTISGTGADEQILGTVGDDVICGLGGHDTIAGGFGNDLILGGRGNDTIEGQDGEDLLSGEQGSDGLDGGPGYDYLDGGGGTDVCVVGADGAFRRQCEL